MPPENDMILTLHRNLTSAGQHWSVFGWYAEAIEWFDRALEHDPCYKARSNELPCLPKG